MNDELNFEVEPFRFQPEFENTALGEFDTELADQEWEEELSRRRPYRAAVRPPRPPVRPIRPPRRRWPSAVVYQPQVAVPEPEGSEHFRWVQHTLNQVMDLRLPVDGVIGPETRSAIRSFQQRQGLPVDGIVGPETERALIAASKGLPSGNTAEFEAFDTELADQEWESEVNRSSRDYIKWVQRSLNQIMGLRLTVDGIVGTYTRSAIRSFQQQRGLTVDGIVGPQTEGALIRAGAEDPPGSGTPFYGSPGGSPSVPGKPSSDIALRVQLARQILNHTGITLGTSSTTPDGNPRQNIIDTTNGLPARSGCYNFSKCGPTTYLSTKMLQALLNLANQGNSFYITSFAGGRHGEGSDHYAGRGVDIGIWNGVSLSTPNSAHTAARNALIAAGSYPSQTFDAYHDTSERNHQNHVHGAFY